MTGKSKKQFLFEVRLNWLTGTIGILSARDADGTLQIATPPEFGGEGGKPWTAEHYFLSAISSCYMATYLAYAAKLAFEISYFESTAIGHIKIINGKYKFTNVNLYPKIYIPDEDIREKANMAVTKTHKNCVIINSLDLDMIYHDEILLDEHPRLAVKRTAGAKSGFSLAEARTIGRRLGIDFEKIDPGEFKMGLESELEHGKRTPETNITNDDVYVTGKIAWAHLLEIPDYYTRLGKMEREAKPRLNGNSIKA